MLPVTTGALKAVASDVTTVAKKEAEGFWKAVYAEPAKAVGSLLALPLNKRLFRNAVRASVEANRLLKEAGLSPKRVPLSIIHPALQGAALEEDPDLQTMWANLIANAADPRDTSKVRPAFVATLKELTPEDATFLRGLYERVMSDMSLKSRPFTDIDYDIFQLKLIYTAVVLKTPPLPPGTPVGIGVDNQFHTLVEILARHGLLASRSEVVSVYATKASDRIPKTRWSLSNLGWSFLNACQPPLPEQATPERKTRV